MYIKAFVFDFDNTLLASDYLVVGSFFKGYEKVMGKKVGIEEVINHYGPDEEGVFYGLMKDKEKAALAFKYYLEEYEELEKKLFKNGFDKEYLTLLKNIKNNGFKLFLVTGRSDESTMISLKYFGLENLFDGIYCGSFYGVNKPDSFRKLEKDNSLSSDEIIYFGDTLNDIKSCKEVDIKICSVGMYVDDKSKQLLKENNNFKVVNTFEELKEFINYLINTKK